jgi:hypothetical protein
MDEGIDEKDDIQFVKEIQATADAIKPARQSVRKLKCQPCVEAAQLLIRWEKKVENYVAMLHFACAWITCRAAGST